MLFNNNTTKQEISGVDGISCYSFERYLAVFSVIILTLEGCSVHGKFSTAIHISAESYKNWLKPLSASRRNALSKSLSEESACTMTGQR